MKEDHRSYRCNFCTCEKKAVTFVTNSNNKMSPKLNFFWPLCNHAISFNL